MSAKDTLRSNKTGIQRALRSDRRLILDKVYEKNLITEREYDSLKRITGEDEEKHVAELVDKIMSKGEERCQDFLDLLQTDEEIKETYPELSNMKLCSTIVPAAGSLSGATGGRASADDKHFVDKHKVVLTQRVSNVSIILDDLLDEEVIDQETYGRIRKISTSVEKMRELYDGPLKGGEECKEIFYKILQKHEKFLIKELKGKK